MKALDILETLKSGGYRMTSARRAIADILSVHTTPLSAADVHAMLTKKKVHTNATTVYRELQFLVEKHLLQTVHFRDGVQRYELADLPHHHHLVCLECHRVEDVHMDHDFHNAEKTIRSKTGFQVQHHTLEFYGICKNCK